MLIDDGPNVVLDLGSSTIKVGFNGESCPRFIIPNVIGKIKKDLIYIIENDNKSQFGNDAIYNSTLYNLDYYQINHNGKFPLENNGKELEEFLNYILFKKLKLKNDTNPGIFIITSILTNPKEKEFLCEILFNKLNIRKIYMESQSVMTLYSTAKTSGLIINSGEIINEIVPIYEGYVIQSGVKTCFKAGKELTNQFLKFYDNYFNYFNVENKFEMAKKIKEKYCEILPFNNNKNYNQINEEFILPDGNCIEINNERFDLPEIFFNSNGCDNHSLQEIISESIDKTDLMFRKYFYNNIILGGGNSCIKGFPERLKSEIENYLKVNNNKIDVKKIDMTNSSERQYSAWIGASGVCSFNNFKTKWLYKENYAENGAQHLIDDFI